MLLKNILLLLQIKGARVIYITSQIDSTFNSPDKRSSIRLKLKVLGVSS